MSKKVKRPTQLNSHYFNHLYLQISRWLHIINYTPETIRGKLRQLHYFFVWLEIEAIESLDEIQQADLKLYKDYLYNSPLSNRTINSRLAILRTLNQYLETQGKDPILKTRLLVLKNQISQPNILSQQQIKALYKACSTDIFGFRDQCILALYYGCGLRYNEGANLLLDDIDLKNEYIHIRSGKHYLERFIPISSTVVQHLKSYIQSARWYWCKQKNNLLLLNNKGEKLGSSSINLRLQSLVKNANIHQRISLHSLRHSIATHLLQSGMDLEYIQRFLGHRSIQTTQIYTRIVYESF